MPVHTKKEEAWRGVAWRGVLGGAIEAARGVFACVCKEEECNGRKIVEDVVYRLLCVASRFHFVEDIVYGCRPTCGHDETVRRSVCLRGGTVTAGL